MALQQMQLHISLWPLSCSLGLLPLHLCCSDEMAACSPSHTRPMGARPPGPREGGQPSPGPETAASPREELGAEQGQAQPAMGEARGWKVPHADSCQGSLWSLPPGCGSDTMGRLVATGPMGKPSGILPDGSAAELHQPWPRGCARGSDASQPGPARCLRQGWDPGRPQGM